MANVVKYNSRIVMKHDIEANWKKAINFIPLAGEIIVYDAEDSSTDLTGTDRVSPIAYERFKIGDGKQTVTALPFVVAKADWNQTDDTQVDYIKNKPIIGAIASKDTLAYDDLTDKPFYEEENGTIHKIDEKYLPEATDDEVMALLAEYEIVSPISDSTGYTYLDIDEKILVL